MRSIPVERLLLFLLVASSVGGCLFTLAPPGSADPAHAADAAIDATADAACNGPLPPDEPTCEADLSSDPRHCGACGHACSSGECREGLCVPRVAGSLTDIRHMAAWDATRIVSSSIRSAGSGILGEIVRWHIDAAIDEVLMPSDQSHVPNQLVVHDGRLTFTENLGIYQLDPTLPDASPTEIQREVRLSSLLAPFSVLAVSDAGTFWSTSEPGALRGVAPGTTGPPIEIASNEPTGPVVADGADLYWIGRSPTANRLRHITVAAIAGPPEDLVTGLSDVVDLAIGSDFVFAADRGAHTIVRVARSGCIPPTNLAEHQQKLEQVAVHADFVYWVTTDNRDFPIDGSFSQSIWRVHLAGGRPLRLLRRAGARLRDLVFFAEGLAVVDRTTDELLFIDP